MFLRGTPLRTAILDIGERIKEKEIYNKRFSLSDSDVRSVVQNDDNIQVCARLKPVPINQKHSCYSKLDDITLRFRKVVSGENRDTCYRFNNVFDSSVSQNSIYDKIIQPEVERFLNGENVLIFSYGTTSSGKTYTIQGNGGEPGIIPRSLLQIFKSLDEVIDETMPLCPNKATNLTKLSKEQMSLMFNDKYKMMQAFFDLKTLCPQKTEFGELRNSLSSVCMKEVFVSLEKEIPSLNVETVDTSYSMWVSFVEVYNENIYDLLDWSSLECDRKPLKLACDRDKANYVKDLNYYLVSCWSEAWKLFMCGRNKLHITATKFNLSSSRSHSIFTLKMVKATPDGQVHCNSFSICDLAGAERQKKVQNEGFRLRETLNINTSLMVLNRCFSVMRENQLRKLKKLVPYRDSKLTQIFKNSLLTDNKILMIVNISQSKDLIYETEQVLKMSAVARDVVISKPIKIHGNQKARFFDFCSASRGVSPRRLILDNDGDKSKDDDIETNEDQKVLKTIISNLEQELKDKEAIYQLKIVDLENEIHQLKDDGNSNCVKEESRLKVSSDDVPSFMDFSKMKRQIDARKFDFSVVDGPNPLEVLQSLNVTRAQLTTKTEECYSLRTRVNSLEYKLTNQNSNKNIQQLIQNLLDQDSKSAMEKLLKEKEKSDHTNQVLESVMDEARKELLYLEQKLNDFEEEINKKTIENEELRSELENKNNLLIKNSKLIAELDRKNEKWRQCYKEMKRSKEELDKKLEKLLTKPDKASTSDGGGTDIFKGRLKDQTNNREYLMIKDKMGDNLI